MELQTAAESRRGLWRAVKVCNKQRRAPESRGELRRPSKQGLRSNEFALLSGLSFDCCCARNRVGEPAKGKE
eukprot:11380547-Alexandrium_andersonii.AAC.1